MKTKDYSEVLNLFDEAECHPKFQQYSKENRKRINRLRNIFIKYRKKSKFI